MTSGQSPRVSPELSNIEHTLLRVARQRWRPLQGEHSGPRPEDLSAIPPHVSHPDLQSLGEQPRGAWQRERARSAIISGLLGPDNQTVPPGPGDVLWPVARGGQREASQRRGLSGQGMQGEPPVACVLLLPPVRGRSVSGVRQGRDWRLLPQENGGRGPLKWSVVAAVTWGRAPSPPVH
ncbi:hypothetical protein NDU88_007541 [Pleurodeles waltl]|uniref:Uncharacterized protein n=1 Tax=Pleurodeles waltl TaxID=8319 RepID=A0AAV7MFH2_PLEWA|nr:hypothetical protein NDU88_007541 [Pleurodeles waltl]